MNNHFSPQIIEHEKDHDCGNLSPDLGQWQCGRTRPVNGITTLLSWWS